MTRANDKRRHPRIAHRLRVRSDHTEDLELETIDLSAGGLSCSAPIYLEPMTRMALSLVLPSNSSAESEQKELRVNGEAVVVRAEREPGGDANGGSYRVALFFSRMEEEDRRRLQEFLKTRSVGPGRHRR